MKAEHSFADTEIQGSNISKSTAVNGMFVQCIFDTCTARHPKVLKLIYEVLIKDISIGSSMVSSAIWEKHARVSFSKTIKITRVRRTV